MTHAEVSPFARLLKTVAKVEPEEVRAVVISFVYFALLMGSYFIVRPVRDAMGTVYGVANLQELYTGTFVVSFVVAPAYAFLASRIRLATFLPWVYGFIAVTMVVFYGLFETVEQQQDRWVAALFFVWVSTFNVLIISVFWSLMADTFSRTQAKRLFGFLAAGGTVGTIAGPALAASLVTIVGTNTLMLISAAGFLVTAWLVTLLEREKRRLGAAGGDVQKTTLDRTLGGNPLEGFALLFRSPYLMMIGLFILLMTTISTIIYFQLGDLITKAFPSREARTQAYAVIDLAVNGTTVFLQLFGTGRLIERFGVTAGLLLNPIIMVFAFLAVAFSPVLFVLGSIQVVRRFAEYAVAKPSREMLFTVVDQDSKYKAKNVIDTVVYRFGDLTSAWLSAAVLPYGVAGLAVAGIVMSAVWFPIAYLLGKRYEGVRGEELVGQAATVAK
ncbi:MAG TPA: MFS transporter [Vicinamibacterales bacterium]|nr:MFS transporter [Vicinamibacterales bacterium]